MAYFDLAVIKTKGFKEYSGSDADIVGAADALLGGRLDVGFAHLPAPEFRPDAISDDLWRTVSDAHGNTFALYLCGLRPVYLLSRATILTGGVEYLRLADALVGSLEKHLASRFPADMAYNDHAIVERIENLAYLVYAAADVGFELQCLESVRTIMTRDVAQLLDGDRYQRNHNHGIMADRAVVIAALFLDNRDQVDWISRAVDRLKEQVTYAYGADGVHCENSFDYHVTVTALLASCVEILEQAGQPYARELKKLVDDASSFIAYALKPNGQAPLFGDSKGSINGTRSIDPFLPLLPDPRHEIEYILSEGASGTRPGMLLKRFDSGYVFLRESFDPATFRDATWISLRAGYTTRTHKQRDDLSIGLYAKGHDVFVDSGMAGYMPDDPVNQHMASVSAHTTTVVDGIEYSVARANGRKFRIFAAQQSQNWDYVGASSHVVPGVAAYRHLYYLRQFGVLVVRDEFISDDVHNYAQLFKLSPDVSLRNPDGDWVSLAIGNADFVADIVQLAGYDELSLHVGRAGDPMSVLSTGFGSTRPTQTLQYRKAGCRTDFVTCVRIREAGSSPVNLRLERERIGVGPVWIPRLPSLPPRFYGAEVSAEDSRLRVRNVFAPGAVQFSAYIFRVDDGAVISKSPYTGDELLTVVNQDKADCVLMYFVRNEQFEVAQGILATCRYVDGVGHAETYSSLHVPEVLQAIYRQIGPTAYEFRIELKYDFPVTVRWWVYRNGVNVQHIPNGTLSASFDFDRAGSYVVMWSVIDPLFGEFAFEQFAPIVVT